MNSISQTSQLSTVFDEYLPFLLNPDEVNEFKNVDDLVASMVYNENSMQISTVSDLETRFSWNTSDQMRFLSDHHRTSSTEFQHKNVDSNVVLMLENAQQSIPCINDGINFEQNYLPNYYFGSTEVAPYMPNIQEEPIIDSDLLSILSSSTMIKSSMNNKQNVISASPQYTTMNEWLIPCETDGKKRRPLLHEFLRLLLDNTNYSHIVEYVDRKKGVFKFNERNEAAKLWQQVKGRNSDLSKFFFLLYIINNS